MNQNHSKFLGLSVLLVLAAVGCGDSNGDSRIDSSVDGNAIASDLSAEETQESCIAISNYFEEQFPESESCKGAGIQAYSLAAATGDDAIAECEAAVQECEEETRDDFLECDDDETVESSCNATVGEIETCMADLIDRQVDAWYGLGVPDCDGMEMFLAEADLGDFADSLSVSYSDIDSCAELDSSCFEDDDDDE